MSSLKESLCIVSIAGITVSSMIFFFMMGDQTLQNLINNASAESAQSIATPEQANSGLPVRLKIPRINVDSSLEYVGITSQGAVDVPKGPTNAAWFDLGPQPGEVGSAIIAGHYGWKNNIPAVFDNLYKLQKGDKLYVVDRKGTTTTFVVRKLQTYSQNEDYSDVFGSSDGKAHLNLITCGGVWNKAQKNYSYRLVVFTDKES